MELHALIQQYFRDCPDEFNEDTVLRKMGYRKRGPATFRRLRAVLCDPDLGLNGGHYDLRFSAQEFACQLCKVLGLQEQIPQVLAIRQRIDQDNAAFQPYLFVDTGFQRTTQPIFALAMCESQRCLDLGREFRRLPMDEQVAYAGEHAKSHCRDNEGQLGIWGTIQRYFFFYEPGRALVFLANGQLLSDDECEIPSRASLPAAQIIIAANARLSPGEDQ